MMTVQIVQARNLLNITSGTTAQIVSPKQLQTNNISNARVQEILENFNLPTNILIGNQIIEQISKRTENILGDVDDKNYDLIKTQLTQLLTLTKSLNLVDTPQEANEKNWLTELLSFAKIQTIKTKEQILSEINTVSGQIDRLVEEIEKSSTLMVDKSKSLQQQYEINLKDYIELDELVKDLTEVLNLKQKELEQSKSIGDNDLLQIEKQVQLSKKIDSLEQKIVDIKKFQMMLMQNAPYISKLEDSAILLVDKFHQIKTLTIPLWKRQIKMYFDSQEIVKSAKLVDSITTTNNKLLIETSTTIGKSLVDITNTNKSAMIEDNTIQTIHDNLIGKLEEMFTIQENTKLARQDSLTMMNNMLQTYNEIKLTHL